MTHLDIEFDSNAVVELSFATISKGLEKQLFEEYFPNVVPIVTEIGGKSLGSFSISASKTDIGDPKMGALFQWPDIEAFKKLHADQRFVKLRPVRDTAMSFFTNGHFFKVLADQTASFKEGQSYALIARWSPDLITELDGQLPMVSLSAITAETEQSYAPNRIDVYPWTEEHAALLEAQKAAGSTTQDVFKLNFKMPS